MDEFDFAENGLLPDMFSMTSLTEAINILPMEVGKIGAEGLFHIEPIDTRFVTFDLVEGRLEIIDPTSRNADPELMGADKESSVVVETMHLPANDKITADDLAVRPLGKQTKSMAVAARINKKLQSMKNKLGASREMYRIGAITGKIFKKNGAVILDLFALFGQEKRVVNVKASEVDKLDFDALCRSILRESEKALAGHLYTGWRAECGAELFDYILSLKCVKEKFLNSTNGKSLTEDLRKGFMYGGIEWREYSGQVGGKKFVDPKSAHIYPHGASNLFTEFVSPANYIDTVGTNGEEFYARTDTRKFNKGLDLEVQTNVLPVCRVPGALTELKLVA